VAVAVVAAELTERKTGRVVMARCRDKPTRRANRIQATVVVTVVMAASVRSGVGLMEGHSMAPERAARLGIRDDVVRTARTATRVVTRLDKGMEIHRQTRRWGWRRAVVVAEAEAVVAAAQAIPPMEESSMAAVAVPEGAPAVPEEGLLSWLRSTFSKSFLVAQSPHAVTLAGMVSQAEMGVWGKAPTAVAAEVTEDPHSWFNRVLEAPGVPVVQMVDALPFVEAMAGWGGRGRVEEFFSKPPK